MEEFVIRTVRSQMDLASNHCYHVKKVVYEEYLSIENVY
jgi:hypothetical protein